MADNPSYEALLKEIIENNKKSLVSNDKEITNQNIHTGTKKEADKIDPLTGQSEGDVLGSKETVSQEQTNTSKTDGNDEKSPDADQTSAKIVAKNGLSSLTPQSEKFAQTGQSPEFQQSVPEVKNADEKSTSTPEGQEDNFQPQNPKTGKSSQETEETTDGSEEENDIENAPTDITVTGGVVKETVEDGGSIDTAHDPSGTTVATLDAVDPNEGDSFTYSITNDASGHFEIVGNEIRVKANQTIDYESASLLMKSQLKSLIQMEIFIQKPSR